MAINKLGTQDVSRITSGQVIVDLKSIVKELVENSIDANCTKIDIVFQNHGIDAITITDDGDGINSKDFESVCLRGHTSKLEDFSDLESLTSLGFRGEALNSVCSIAQKVKIHTSTKQEYPKTYELEYNHMGILNKLQKKVGGLGKNGTSIVIEKIFGNLPVRHKNMIKNLKKEFHRAINFLINYLIIHPHIKFSVFNVTNKKNIVLNSVGGKMTSILDNMVTIFGTNGSRGLSPIDIKISSQIQIKGFISNHSFGMGRSVQDRQFLYINKRPVLLKKVQKLINDVFKQYNHLQYPVFVLNLVVDPNFLDVNVTPDKTIVLLHNEVGVLDQIREGITTYFATQDNVIPKNKNSEVNVNDDDLSIMLRGGSKSTTKVPQKPNVVAVNLKLLQSGVEERMKTNGIEVISFECPDIYEDTALDKCGSEQEQEKEYKQEEIELQNEELENGKILLGGDQSGTARKQDIEKLDLKPKNEIENSQPILKRIFGSSRRYHENLNIEVEEITYESGSKEEEEEEEEEKEDAHTFEKVTKADTTFEYTKPNGNFETIDGGGNKDFLAENKIVESSEVYDSPTKESLDSFNHSLHCNNSQNEDNYGKNFYPAEKSNDEIKLRISGREIIEQPLKRARKQDLVHNLTYTLPIYKSDWRLQNELLQPQDVNQREIQVDDLGAVQDQEEKLSCIISKDDFLKMKLVGQFNLGFILVSLNDNNIFIIDQHASDEKYNFERLSETFVMGFQRMVVPQYIDMSIIDEILVIEHQTTFQKNGFVFEVDMERDPGRRIRLLTLPVLRNNTFSISDFYELINLINENPTNVRCSKIMRVLAMRACRGSTMIGQSLTKSRMVEIVRHLHHLDKPWNCPHGRPTMRHLVQLDGWKPFSVDYDI
jgi:DNA mismatch repair protein PMS2